MFGCVYRVNSLKKKRLLFTENQDQWEQNRHAVDNSEDKNKSREHQV